MTLPAWFAPVWAWIQKAALASVGYIVAEGAAYLHLATIGLVISTGVYAGLLILIAVKFGAVFAVIAAVVLFFGWGLLTAHTGVASAAAVPKLVAMSCSPPKFPPVGYMGAPYWPASVRLTDGIDPTTYTDANPPAPPAWEAPTWTP